MKPEELVKKTKLDRITGTRSVTRKDGYMFVELSEGDKKDLETIDNLTGKTLYIVEHGASQVMDLFEEGNSQVVIDDSTGKTGLAVDAIDISGDFDKSGKVDLLDFSIWKIKYLQGQMSMIDFGKIHDAMMMADGSSGF